ncbi:MAG: hypothetical protein WEE67_09430 [Chloroflexota bacterium]
MTTTDRWLEEAVTAALDVSLTPGQQAVIGARVERALRAAPIRPQWRVTGRSLLLVAALFVVLPAILGVGAAILSTEDPFGLASGAGFEAELDAAIAITAIPAGATWPDYLVTDRSASYSRGGGRAWVEYVAMCMWEVEWLNARASGDAAREAAARATILDFPNWWSTDSVWFRPEGARREYLEPIVAGVRSGDAGPLTRDVELNCAGTEAFVRAP